MIDIFYLLQGKMAAFMSRCSNNDMRDIQHLVQRYSTEIRSFAPRLDPEAVSCFLDAMPAERRPQWKAIFGF